MEDQPILSAEHSSLFTSLLAKHDLRVARGKREARAILDDSSPTVIIALDAGTTKPENQDIADDLVDRVWAGATLILAGGFGTANEPDLMRTLDKVWGLPWKYAGKRSEMACLKTDVAGDMGLPARYALEAVMMDNVEPISVWYEVSMSEHTQKAAVVVLTGYGKGKLGFVGDAHLKDESKEVILKMLETKV